MTERDDHASCRASGGGLSDYGARDPRGRPPLRAAPAGYTLCCLYMLGLCVPQVYTDWHRALLLFVMAALRWISLPMLCWGGRADCLGVLPTGYVASDDAHLGGAPDGRRAPLPFGHDLTFLFWSSTRKFLSSPICLTGGAVAWPVDTLVFASGPDGSRPEERAFSRTCARVEFVLPLLGG